MITQEPTTKLALNQLEADKILKSILHDNHHTVVEDSATLKNGIRKLNATQRNRFRTKFKKKAKLYTYTDFIPASGSGSRLLSSLIAFAKAYSPQTESLSHYINRTQSYNLNMFFHHMKDLPFYDIIQNDILRIMDEAGSMDERRLRAVQYILETDKLNICKLPKALIPIHLYKVKSKTAIDEQLDLHSKVVGFVNTSLHFTIAPIQEKRISDYLSSLSKDERFDITYSIQNPDTDVYCLNKDQLLAVDENDDFLKRPSGHGALLDNLQKIESDIIHISNIDNVPTLKNQKAYLKNRKQMIGYLIYCVEQIHKYLEKLEDDELKGTQLKRLAKFLKRYFHLDLPQILENSEEGELSTVYHLLNAPIRIAAMIPIGNYAGGGPYWIKNEKGIKSLQIVETAEIDFSNPIQKLITDKTTHFNPVSIFLYSKDYKGNKFEFDEYATDSPTMVIDKTYNGQDIRFIEQAGLWNGKMRDHLTMFIQADESIFNPIKELTDIFSDKHLTND